jgi:tRNA nucleotidyltransferase (CCA-adding enzyme)
MWKALVEPQPWRFFEVLHRCGALSRLIPELAAVMGRQDSHQAGQDANPMAALKRVVKLTPEAPVRFAVTMFQPAIQSHAPERFIAGLRVDRQAAELLHDLLELAPLQAAGVDPGGLLRSAKRLRLSTRPQRHVACETAGRALWPDTMPEIARGLALAVDVLNEVGVQALRDQGLEGADLGKALHARQLESLAARLPVKSC